MNGRQLRNRAAVLATATPGTPLAATLADRRGPGEGLDDLPRRAGEGDAVVRRLLDDAARAVGMALGSATMVGTDVNCLATRMPE